MEVFDQINEIYATVCDRLSEIRAELKKAGVETTWGFYNNHYVKRNGRYVAERYPIPVASAREGFDIGVDMEESWVEFHVGRDRALGIDYSALMETFSFEVYGAADYLGDFQTSGVSQIAQEIAESGEKQICICIHFPGETGAPEIVDAIWQFNRLIANR